ncbi:MAG: cytochrome C oxidase subunit IV family protein [Longimicrobiales bacterium]|nr:cytochrome C oxidase subunit IV family protein [Longimicrobiales bacterium]
MADAVDRNTEHPEEHDHPGTMTYLIVAAVLTILTALEVAIFYIPALSNVIVPLLLTLTTGKFVLVVMFYMHLKMDSQIFTGVFVAPMLLAMFLVVALIVLFNVLPAYS